MRMVRSPAEKEAAPPGGELPQGALAQGPEALQVLLSQATQGGRQGQSLLQLPRCVHGPAQTVSTFPASWKSLAKPAMVVTAARSSCRSMSLSYSTTTSEPCTISRA